MIGRLAEYEARWWRAVPPTGWRWRGAACGWHAPRWRWCRHRPGGRARARVVARRRANGLAAERRKLEVVP